MRMGLFHPSMEINERILYTTFVGRGRWGHNSIPLKDFKKADGGGGDKAADKRFLQSTLVFLIGKLR